MTVIGPLTDLQGATLDAVTQIDYQQQNYLDFKIEQKFDLICMIMCDFCALSPKQRQQLLGIFHHQLKDDGALFLDVYSLSSYAQRQDQSIYEFKQLHGFWSAEDYYGFVNSFKYEAEKVVLDKYNIIEAKRTREINNWLQYYSLESLTKEFAEYGFSINETYADTTGTAYRPDSAEIAVVAKKA